jgi:DNA-binding CsgD family transcriptional regulator
VTSGNELSTKEREVLHRVANGATTNEMAKELRLGPDELPSILQAIFEKLSSEEHSPLPPPPPLRSV